jgi:hypothetical protein
VTNWYKIYKNFKQISHVHTNFGRHSIYQFKLFLRNTKQSNYATFILYKYFSPKTYKFLFNKITGRTFNFEAINIHDHSCPSSYKLLNHPSKIVGLHIIILIKQDMVIELCA